MPATVVELTVDEIVGERRAELEQLWLDVWPETSDRLDAILPRHTRREGFLFLAVEDGDRIVGFAYGYVGGDGEPWHERVARAMTAEQRARWLRAARPTAVLATEVDNEPAIAFYEGRGWETIIPELRIGRLYRIMGRG